MYSFKSLYYRYLLPFYKVTLYLFVLLFSNSIFAVVNVEGTRVIFNANDRAVSLSLANSEKQPTVVQLWLDEGDFTVSPELIKTPIIIATPMFSMKQGEVRSVTLMLPTRKDLPKDKEAMYWLNIYQIPPNTHDSLIQIDKKVVLPLRIRMKVFIRPEGVEELTQTSIEQLKFRIQKKGEQTNLVISNPTPWHINIGDLNVSDEHFNGIIVSPKSEFSLILKKQVDHYRHIDFDIINDFGKIWHYSLPL